MAADLNPQPEKLYFFHRKQFTFEVRKIRALMDLGIYYFKLVKQSVHGTPTSTNMWVDVIWLWTLIERWGFRTEIVRGLSLGLWKAQAPILEVNIVPIIVARSHPQRSNPKSHWSKKNYQIVWIIETKWLLKRKQIEMGKTTLTYDEEGQFLPYAMVGRSNMQAMKREKNGKSVWTST